MSNEKKYFNQEYTTSFEPLPKQREFMESKKPINAGTINAEFKFMEEQQEFIEKLISQKVKPIVNIPYKEAPKFLRRELIVVNGKKYIVKEFEEINYVTHLELDLIEGDTNE